MINGMNVFYTSSKGKGLEPVQTKGKGLEPIQTKGKGCKPKKITVKHIKNQALKYLINISY